MFADHMLSFVRWQVMNRCQAALLQHIYWMKKVFGNEENLVQDKKRSVAHSSIQDIR